MYTIDKPMHIAWSFSSLTTGEKCMASIYFQKIMKISDNLDNVKVIVEGKKQHQLLEDYIKDLKAGKPATFPEGAKKIKDKMDKVLEEYSLDKISPEKKYAFTKDFEKEVDFFAKDVWMRGIADLIAIDGKKAVIVDYKNSKKSPYNNLKYMSQLQLYSLIIFMTNPEVESVNASIWLLKDGNSVNQIHYRKKLPFYLQNYVERGNKFFNATEFPAKSSKSNCKFCFYKEKTCDYAQR